MHWAVSGQACQGLALLAGGQYLGGHLSHGPSPARPPRLLRSLVNLKQVIINAAHYLVLGDKKSYHFDPESPFLQMVSPAPAPAQGDPLVCSPVPRTVVRGHCPFPSRSWSESSVPGAAAGPHLGHVWGVGGGKTPSRPSPVIVLSSHPLHSRMTPA